MKSPARRFTLLMLAMSLIVVGAAALLNWRVDPYERFGNNHLGIYVTADREVKAAEVTRYPHNALYVGNSRMHVIQASQLKGFRFFNGGFAAATLEEIYWYLHRYAHGLELVVIGIDLGMDNPAEGDTAALRGDIFSGESWAANAEHLVNLQTTILSFKTLFRHRAHKPGEYLPDGSTREEDWGNATRPDDPSAGKPLMDQYKNYIASALLNPVPRLTYLRKIADTLRERKILCVAIVPPVHEEVMRHVESLHLQRGRQVWTEAVRTIFPDLIDLSSSPYGAARNCFAKDPIHYKAAVGAAFMNAEVLPFAMKALGKRLE